LTTWLSSQTFILIGSLTFFNGGRRVNAVAAEFTTSQKILIAAFRLEEKGHSPFSAEELIVAAWQESQRTFGLKGFIELYPDSNRVLSCIMGEKGLARRGWLSKMGKKLYSLSRQGKEEARRLLEGGAEATAGSLPRTTRPKPVQAPVVRELEQHLMNLISAPAVRRFSEGMKREISYRDACRFWGLSDNIHGEAVDKQLSKVQDAIAEAEGMMVGDNLELSNGQSISSEDLKDLVTVHKFLLEQFTRHLSLQRERPRRF
jgi:DNA-binding PadR family transcriptional regulator